MFFKKYAPTNPQLDYDIAQAHLSLAVNASHTKEYASTVDQLTKLYALKETPCRLSPDTLATIAANLLGIALIVGYERANVMTSKATGFIGKLTH